MERLNKLILDKQTLRRYSSAGTFGLAFRLLDIEIAKEAELIYNNKIEADLRERTIAMSKKNKPKKRTKKQPIIQ